MSFHPSHFIAASPLTAAVHHPLNSLPVAYHSLHTRMSVNFVEGVARTHFEMHATVSLTIRNAVLLFIYLFIVHQVAHEILEFLSTAPLLSHRITTFKDLFSVVLYIYSHRLHNFSLFLSLTLTLWHVVIPNPQSRFHNLFLIPDNVTHTGELATLDDIKETMSLSHLLLMFLPFSAPSLGGCVQSNMPPSILGRMFCYVRRKLLVCGLTHSRIKIAMFRTVTAVSCTILVM